MYKRYSHKDVFFSTKLQEFFVITEAGVSIQDVLDNCCKKSSTTIFPYDEYTIIETDEKAYAIKNTIENVSMDEKPDIQSLSLPKKSDNLFDSSKQFACVILALIVAFAFLDPFTVMAITGTLSDSQHDIAPLEGVQFTTAVGTIAVNPVYADHSSGELGFSLLDPRPLGQTLQVRNQPIPAGLDSRFLEAVLMFRKANTQQIIQQQTGLNATQAQIDGAEINLRTSVSSLIPRS